ncbi:MAG: diguanylate cyclase [Gallionella sp.]|nr:diguanylate cyclase [Gallionella sp.]
MGTTRFRRGGRVLHKSQGYRIDRPVLLIEDQRALARMAEAMLRDEWGCEVMIAATLDEARQLLEDHGKEFIAAVCDLNLPDAPYGEVIDLVNKYGVPAIALTGAFGEELRNMVIKKGVVDYVLKEGINSYDYVINLVGRIHKNKDIKVLVADDSLSARAVLKHMLSVQGLNVLIAKDGYEAVEILEQHPDIKLVLVDYNMPKMNGFKFVLEARKRMGKDQLSIIGISGENGGNISVQFLKNGANDFIAKPYSYEELICRVTQNLEMVESIQNIANRDYLTGLYNRRFFFDEGYNIYEHAMNSGSNLFIAMIDVDHFKKVNDDYGHDCGDMVLKHLAAQLSAYFSNDLIARLGGEEFALLISDEDVQSTRKRLEAFRQHIERETVNFGTANIAFTVSIGGSHHPLESLDMMLKTADENLYHAKQSGRNRVVA